MNKAINYSTSKGFSLVEMAIALMIMGALLSGVLVAVSTSLENSRRTNAKAELRQIEEALYGYAQATGRLPCPAANDGSLESRDGSTGVCDTYHGFVPSATLGIFGSVDSNGFLLDPWQNPYRYSVASKQTSTSQAAFTLKSGLQYLYDNDELTSVTPPDPNLLHVCDSASCSGVVLTDIAPAVVVSMGANWGSYSSTDEQENAGDGSSTVAGYSVTDTNDFVSTEYNEDDFDDQLVWLSPYVLFNKLISAGQLP